MLGDAVLYAASRATHSAIENVSRRATWAAVAGAFFLCALVAFLIAAFMVAEPKLGALGAIGLIAGGCLLAGICALSVPWVTDKMASQRTRSTAATAVAVADQEAQQAADYFGAMQVVGAAFLFGLSAARRLKR